MFGEGVALAALTQHTRPNEGVPYHNDNAVRTQDEAVAWVKKAIGTLKRRIEA